MHIIVSQEIESVCPNFVGAAVEAQVVNTPYCDALWDEIHALEARFRSTLTTESLKELSGIAATRRVYKACGKDPSRYRPASEQLIRRMLQGKELYQIDTLVDLVNLASIAYGYDGQEERVLANARFIQELLHKYCQSDGGTVMLYR